MLFFIFNIHTAGKLEFIETDLYLLIPLKQPVWAMFDGTLLLF